jgi:hypothetical protein
LSGSSLGGVSKTALAAIAVAMIVLAIGVGAFFESQGPPVTSLTVARPSGESALNCEWSVPSPLQASSTVTVSTSGCLPQGTAGRYLIAATSQVPLNMTGTISAKYPIGISIGGYDVGNLSAYAGTVYAANDTASVSLTGVTLAPDAGYAIAIRNEGSQNNTVTIDIQLTDEP